MPSDPQPVISCASAEHWDAWLSAHHTDSTGVWLMISRKGARAETVQYGEAVEVALCHGWIDGQKRRLDGEYWLQRFTPRGPRSKWSKVNTEKAAALIETGRMKPAGLREVDRAKADGRWDAAYEPQSRISVPHDFAQALASNDRARGFFATLDSANRYAILYRVAEAKRPQTRAKRIAAFVAMLGEHKKIHPG